jgi:hypothetical protein
MRHRWPSLLLLSVALMGCATHSSGIFALPAGWGYYRCGSVLCSIRVHHGFDPFSLMSGGETSTAEYVPMPSGTHFVGEGYATDGHDVWCGGNRITRAKNFRPLGGPFFAVDGAVRYHCSTVTIQNAPLDPKSFEVLGSGLVRYHGAIYRQSRPGTLSDDVLSTKGAMPFEAVSIVVDPGTFYVWSLGSSGSDRDSIYGIDDKTVYQKFDRRPRLDCGWIVGGPEVKYGEQIVLEADPSTFYVIRTNLKCGYATDRRFIFYQGRVLEGADRNTFVAIPWDPSEFAWDRLRRYAAGRPLPKEKNDGFEKALRQWRCAFGPRMITGPGAPYYPETQFDGDRHAGCDLEQ